MKTGRISLDRKKSRNIIPKIQPDGIQLILSNNSLQLYNLNDIQTLRTAMETKMTPKCAILTFLTYLGKNKTIIYEHNSLDHGKDNYLISWKYL